jgi:hypothetical protein
MKALKLYRFAITLSLAFLTFACNSNMDQANAPQTQAEFIERLVEQNKVALTEAEENKIIDEKCHAENLFAEAEIIDDSQLSESRGAFFSGDTVFNFGITRNTLVDGIEVAGFSFNTADQSFAEDIQNFQTLINIDNGNVSVQNINSANLPSFFTLIQNNTNNVSIQNLNTIDLQVENLMEPFAMQSGIFPEIKAGQFLTR